MTVDGRVETEYVLPPEDDNPQMQYFRNGEYEVTGPFEPDGRPRVTKTYSESTAPQRFRIDDPGFTAMYTLSNLRRILEEAENEDGNGGA